MTEIISKIGKIKTIWKELSLVGAWIATISSSFLLPLPDWASDEENKAVTQFVLFVATVVAGFVLILTFKFRSKKLWLYTSISMFLIFVSTFFLYSLTRESTTLPYYGKDKVIGTITVQDYDKKLAALEKEIGYRIDPNDLLVYVGGKPTLLWTQDSIDGNRWKLIYVYMLTFSVLTIFLISFLNLLMLYGSETENKD